MLIASMTYEEMYREIRSDFRDLTDAITKDQLNFHSLAKRAKKYPYGRVYEWKHPKSHNTYTYFFQVKRHSEWNKEPRLVIFTEFDDENSKTTIPIVNDPNGNIRISIFRPHFFQRYYERNLTTIKGDIPETEREIKLAFLSRTSTVVFMGKEVDINIDFIIALIEKHRVSKASKDSNELKDTITRAIGSSPLLRNKKDLIDEFVRRYATDREVSQQWAKFVSEQAHRQLEQLIAEEKLDTEQTVEFMRHAFHIGEVERNGDRITKCLPPLPLFAPDNRRAITKQRVLDRLCNYFDRFYDIYEFE